MPGTESALHSAAGIGNGAGRAVRLEMPHLFKKRDEVDPCDKDDSCLVAIGSFNVQEKKNTDQQICLFLANMFLKQKQNPKELPPYAEA